MKAGAPVLVAATIEEHGNPSIPDDCVLVRFGPPARDAARAIVKVEHITARAADGMMDDHDVALEKIADEHATLSAAVRSAEHIVAGLRSHCDDVKDALDTARRARGLIR